MNLRLLPLTGTSKPQEAHRASASSPKKLSRWLQTWSTDTSTGYKQLNTIGIVPIIVKAAQEQQSLIATNTQKVANLEITFDEFGLLSLNSTASGSAQLITTATATPSTTDLGLYQCYRCNIRGHLTKTKNLIVSGQAQIATLTNL